jgi:hypothetical protein
MKYVLVPLGIDASLGVEPTIQDHEAAPIGQSCSLLELTDDTCRWPIGDPGSSDAFFCGGKTVEGFPYCSYHVRLAYGSNLPPGI